MYTQEERGICEEYITINLQNNDSVIEGSMIIEDKRMKKGRMREEEDETERRKRCDVRERDLSRKKT